MWRKSMPPFHLLQNHVNDWLIEGVNIFHICVEAWSFHCIWLTESMHWIICLQLFKTNLFYHRMAISISNTSTVQQLSLKIPSPTPIMEELFHNRHWLQKLFYSRTNPTIQEENDLAMELVAKRESHLHLTLKKQEMVQQYFYPIMFHWYHLKHLKLSWERILNTS